MRFGGKRAAICLTWDANTMKMAINFHPCKCSDVKYHGKDIIEVAYMTVVPVDWQI